MKLEEFLLGCSPLPLRLKTYLDAREREMVCIDAGRDDAVADLCGRGGMLSRAKMNGAYLVHAANTLPELVVAARQFQYSVLRNGQAGQEMILRLQNALAAAEEVTIPTA